MEQKKEITFSKEGREKLQLGIDKVANAVKVTLGGKGRNVIIDRYPFPHVTKDGVTVANEINLEDPIENMGARLIKQVASKTANDSGDGTTSRTVLAQEILTRGLESINHGANPIEVQKGMNKAVEKVVAFLKENAMIVDDDISKLRQVAKISANGDDEVADLVSEVMSRIKLDGDVKVEFSNADATRVEIVDGTKILSGLLSPHFINNPSKRRAEHKDCLVLLYDGHMSTMKDITPMIEAYYNEYPEGSSNQPTVVIISSLIDGEALSSLIYNKINGGFQSLVIGVNGAQNDKLETLQDIKAVVGGEVLSQTSGISMKEFTFDMFGKASMVVSNQDFTTIANDGSEESIAVRAEVIRGQIETEKENTLRTGLLKGRLARLNGGVAVIYVGGKTQAEMLERKDRIDDAVGATMAAMTEGVVPGGGVALFRAIKSLEDVDTSNPQEAIGAAIIKSSLSAPLFQILRNGGYVDGDSSKSLTSIVSEIQSSDFNYGFDIVSEKIVDMIEQGIIDPVKVVRNSIENSSSIAGLLLTTEVVISNKQDKI